MIRTGVSGDDRAVQIVRVDVPVTVVVRSVFTDLVCALEDRVVIVVAVQTSAVLIDLAVRVEVGEQATLAGAVVAALTLGARIAIIAGRPGDGQLFAGALDARGLRAGVLGVRTLGGRAGALSS
jgi:hypothetical protein